jgi:hypothetical protein
MLKDGFDGTAYATSEQKFNPYIILQFPSMPIRATFQGGGAHVPDFVVKLTWLQICPPPETTVDDPPAV